MAAKPTEAQVLELIKQYTTQFDYIVQAVQIYWGFRKKWDATDKEIKKLLAEYKPAQAQVLIAQNKKLSDDMYKYAKSAIIPAYSNWYVFGAHLRDAQINIPRLPISDVLDKATYPKLIELQKALHDAKVQQNVSGEATGFLPLIIWGIIAIVALFTADDIVKQVDSSTAQQKALVDSTNQLCKDQGLNTEDCKKLLADQQQTIQTTEANQGGGFFGDIKSLFLWGAAIFVGVKFVVPALTKTKTS